MLRNRSGIIIGFEARLCKCQLHTTKAYLTSYNLGQLLGQIIILLKYNRPDNKISKMKNNLVIDSRTRPREYPITHEDSLIIFSSFNTIKH
jgi:hypothetical protein